MSSFHSLLRGTIVVLLMSTLHVRGSERWTSLFAHRVGETCNNSASVSRPEEIQQAQKHLQVSPFCIFFFLESLCAASLLVGQACSPAEPYDGGLGQPCAPA